MNRTKTGIVTSASADKTITVTVHTYQNHPIYQKRFRISKKFHAHDPENSAQVGDTVTISETRPLSRQKRWSLTSIDQKAPQTTALPEENNEPKETNESNPS